MVSKGEKITLRAEAQVLSKALDIAKKHKDLLCEREQYLPNMLYNLQQELLHMSK